jgi:hypothetical protein
MRLTLLYRTGLLLSVSLVAAACGGGDHAGTGPPVVEDDDAEIVPSVMGTCQKLCCSDLDCPSGLSCHVLDASGGSLGTCSEAPPAGSTSSAAGCWTLNPQQCNPISNEGCASGESCDFDEGDESIEPVVMCFSNAEPVLASQECDAVYGSPCEVGYHCRPN